jgi:cytidine diphosphoramidate kinase
MVIWLIGMSASGKTTIAQEMIKTLRRDQSKSWVLVDGDAFRNIMAEDLGHSPEARRKNADRLCALCAFFDKQGISVLACVLSVFHEHQDWLREHIEDYRQAYIQVDYDVLKTRDNKELYRGAENGKIDNVVGVHIPFPEPKKSNFVLDNNKEGVLPAELADKVMKGLGFAPDNVDYAYTEKDLVRSPFKYQYLPFEGKGFLKAYRQNRMDGVEVLREKMHEYALCCPWGKTMAAVEEKVPIAAFLDASDELPGGHELWEKTLGLELLPDNYRQRFITYQELEDKLVTREYMVKELEALHAGKWNYSERSGLLFALLRRFEVSKKIYTFYRLPEVRMVKKDSGDLLNFVLFQMLLGKAHQHAPDRAKLILENGLLKMGDLLVSISSRLVSPAQIALACVSLAKELQIMEKRYGI